jgi:uncharacterized spore protein YtfJ
MNERTAPDVAAIDVMRRAVEGATAGTVFGEPITRGDVTVVPVARLSGRGGGGGGSAPSPDDGQGGGAGGGLALSAKPAGVIVIKDDSVGWRPVVDVNKVIIGGQVVALAALMTIRALVKARRS